MTLLHFCILLQFAWYNRVHFYRILQHESAVNRRQVKCSGSLIGTDDVTAARRSVPFYRRYTTSTCMCHES